MKYLILFLLTFNCFASGYMSKAQMIRSDKNTSSSWYATTAECSKFHADCSPYPDNYNWETYSYQNTSVDDKTKPNYSKSEVQTCTDSTDCQAKLEAIVSNGSGSGTGCIDPAESPVKVLNSTPKEVYCTKFLGTYQQKIVSLLKEDAAKKAAYDTAQAATTASENAIASALKAQAWGKRVMGLMMVRNASKSLTTAQKVSLINTYSTIQALLQAGSLQAAKDEISNVTADGTLVTAGDKAALIAEIDKYLIP